MIINLYASPPSSSASKTVPGEAPVAGTGLAAEMSAATAAWCQSHQTFYDCNLQIFVISCSFCPQQAFPALGKDRAYPRMEHQKSALLR
jgi:hypothetical protein